MYLSKVSLHSTAQAAAELARLQSNGAYSAHQLLWKLFSENDERNFIFRQEQNTNGLPYFYVLSQTKPRELPSPIFDLQVKEFSPKVAVGQRLAFKLRANPTICITDGGKKKRHDVLMHAKKHYEAENLEKSELDFVVNQAAQAWLANEQRLEKWGVQLDFIPNVQVYTQHKTRKAKDKIIQFSSVDFEGVLTITDSDKFLSQYAKGYGRAKSFGVWAHAYKAGVMAFIPLKPIPIKERNSMIFVGKGRIDVRDGAFVVIDEVNGERMHIPVGSVVCIMLEPGTRVSHAAVKLASTVGTLLIWVGEAGVRLYSVGQPGGARSDKLLYQAKLALDDDLRLKVVRKMFEIRFKEPAPQRRSIDQLRGIEGARVRATYKMLAQQYGVEWHGRKYDVKDWQKGDVTNQCISAATSCLYGITEAAILAAGYAPAIGFLHSGKPLSFVYDIADLVKFDTVVPVAFKVAASAPTHPDRAVRVACREAFRTTKLLKTIIPLIENVLAAGEIEPPKAPEDAQPPAIPEPENIGDIGHRSK